MATKQEQQKRCAVCRHWAPYQTDPEHGLCGVNGNVVSRFALCMHWVRRETDGD